MDLLFILGLIDRVLVLLSRIPNVQSEAEALRAELAAMIAEGRNPTKAERDALNKKLDDLFGNLPPP